MILMIDNYDSFTFNLVQYLGEICSEKIEVYRNDKITVEQIRKTAPSAIVISFLHFPQSNRRNSLVAR